MRKILPVLTALVAFSCASSVSADGALAIDNNQGDQYGFSYNYPSSGAAQDKALAECGSGCSIVETYSGGCAAYAADQASGSTVYGWGTASDSSQAQNTAMQYCQNSGGTQCIVRVWGCDSN